MKGKIKKIIAFVILSQIAPLIILINESIQKCHPLIDAYLAGLVLDGAVILFGLLLTYGVMICCQKK